MADSQASEAPQHKYSTRHQAVARDPLSQESRSSSNVPSIFPTEVQAQQPTRSISSSPMAKAIAVINLLAFERHGTEQGRSLLALSTALENVELQILRDEEDRQTERMERGGEALQGMEGVEGHGKRDEEEKESMCSKTPFVELIIGEAQRVDRESLRGLLMYIGGVVRALEEVLGGDVRR
ncbi:hypothetical protein ONS96_004975 [Cadophora gregata f. sp. sojae]|nr:hypothetical protein ONS96_004975 [Cadophora gregata f. sp. sojae]